VGHSRAEKAESHDRIVKVAATRFRENGVEGVGVADLMKDAGLTHGGFYRHFASRDELVAEAIERALGEGSQAVAVVAQAQDCPVDALVDAYLRGPSIDWGIVNRAVRSVGYVAGWGPVDGMDATFGWDRD